jgi:GTP pyrophosphokinase
MPDDYNRTMEVMSELLSAREKSTKVMEKEIGSTLRTEGIKFLEIVGRVKRVYSLYKKLQKYDGDISKVYDVQAFRIITKSTSDCYAALGIVHKHFQPVPGRVKDFIAIPKPNGYQSLHTCVFDHDGNVFEIQIRTDLMHETAERGIAAHWFYTEQGKPDEHIAPQTAGWIQELHAWQEETMNNPDEFLESLKVDFFRDRIFVLTPKGDVKDLPMGASVIDFAFAVHSDLGFHMMGAKINGKMASIYDELKQGDVVEVLKTKKPVSISRDWLASAKTSHGRSVIRKYLKENDKGIFQRVRELKLQDLGTLPKFFRKQ